MSPMASGTTRVLDAHLDLGAGDQRSGGVMRSSGSSISNAASAPSTVTRADHGPDESRVNSVRSSVGMIVRVTEPDQRVGRVVEGQIDRRSRRHRCRDCRGQGTARHRHRRPVGTSPPGDDRIVGSAGGSVRRRHGRQSQRRMSMSAGRRRLLDSAASVGRRASLGSDRRCGRRPRPSGRQRRRGRPSTRRPRWRARGRPSPPSISVAASAATVGDPRSAVSAPARDSVSDAASGRERGRGS